MGFTGLKWDWACIAAIGFAVLPVFATEISTTVGTNQPPLSLATAERLAFLHNWDLLAAQSDVDIATAQSYVAREFPNPTISVSTAKINADHNPGHTGNGNGVWDRNYDTIAAISQLIELGGKRAARKDAARAGLRGAEARLTDARRLLEQAVTKAYVGALLAERNQTILGESAATLRQEANIAQVRHHAGDISAADKTQIEIAADRLELDARTAGTTARSARIQLQILLGERMPTGNLQLDESLEQVTTFAYGQVPEQPAEEVGLVEPRADLVAAEAARVKAAADLRLQRAQRVPDPTFSLQYEHEPPDQPNTIGFAISFPLPLWSRNRGNIAAAEASAQQAAAQVEKVRAQIGADIANARAAFAASQERWRRFRDELLPKSQRVRASVAFAYEKGGASLLDLLTAQRTDNDVRLATAQAAADSANAAADLRAALTPMIEIHPHPR